MSASASQPDTDRRRQPRRTVLWPARLIAGDKQHSVWVRNISARGAAIQSDAQFAAHMPVCLTLERAGSFDMFVVWSGDRLHGLTFVDAPEVVIRRFGADADTFGLL